MRRTRLPGVLLAVLSTLVLAGCAGTPPVTAAPGAGTPGTNAAGAGPDAEAANAPGTAPLLEARRAAGIADCPAADPGVPAVPNGLPEVTLPCFGEDSQVRLAGLRGKPLVINVWAQWCGPCRTEAPMLREYADRVAAAGAPVQLLGVDYADPRPDLALEFAQQAGWRYPQLVDPGKKLAAGLNIIGPPQTILVRADGSIAYRHPGPVTSTQQLADLVAQHLGVRV